MQSKVRQLISGTHLGNTVYYNWRNSTDLCRCLFAANIGSPRTYGVRAEYHWAIERARSEKWSPRVVGGLWIFTELRELLGKLPRNITEQFFLRTGSVLPQRRHPVSAKAFNRFIDRRVLLGLL